MNYGYENHLLSGMILQVPPKRCYFERLLLELSKRTLLLVYAFPPKTKRIPPLHSGTISGREYVTFQPLIDFQGDILSRFQGEYM